MNRTFIFCVQELNYQKGDLSIPYSDKRAIIGTLSRMITNAIFLSHKLRQGITIRIFVLQPKPHLYEIKSDSIRYLGPDLRSSASLLLKGEQFLIEKLTIVDNNKQLIWYEPNPGIFLSITNDPLINLNIRKNSKIFYFTKPKDNEVSDEPNISLVDFDQLMQRYKPLIFSFNIEINNSTEKIFSEISLDNIMKKIKLINLISFPSIVSSINLMLDDLKINDI